MKSPSSSNYIIATYRLKMIAILLPLIARKQGSGFDPFKARATTGRSVLSVRFFFFI